jgi:predicted phosphoribosyltransferase
VKEELPSKIIVATSVAPPSTVERLKKLADDVIVSSEPEPFYAIGEFYVDFPQVSDEEVIKVLKEANK